MRVIVFNCSHSNTCMGVPYHAHSSCSLCLMMLSILLCTDQTTVHVVQGYVISSPTPRLGNPTPTPASPALCSLKLLQTHRGATVLSPGRHLRWVMKLCTPLDICATSAFSTKRDIGGGPSCSLRMDRTNPWCSLSVYFTLLFQAT